MENTNGLMVEYTQANGTKTIFMELADMNGQTAEAILEDILMIWKTEKELFIGPKVKNIREYGFKAFNMGLADL